MRVTPFFNAVKWRNLADASSGRMDTKYINIETYIDPKSAFKA